MSTGPAMTSILLTLSILAGIVILWIRVLRRPPATHPTCGKCGYRVRGLDRLNCPECGSDLLEAGIVPASKHSMGPGIFSALWLGMMIPVGLAGWGFLSMVIPRSVRSTSQVTLRTISASIPDLTIKIVSLRNRFPNAGTTGISTSTSTTGANQADGSMRLVTSTTLTLPPLSGVAGSPTTIEFSTATQALRTFKHTDSLDAEEFATWLSALDGDPETSAPAEDTTAITNLLKVIQAGQVSFTSTRFTTTGQLRSITGRIPPPWYYPTAYVAAWSFVMVTGFVVFTRVRRTREAEARATAADG